MDPYDHRVLGQRLGLFHQQAEAPGMIFWHPRGFALYRVIEIYVRRRMTEAGFLEVRTPQVLSRAFWEASGHWEKFGEAMFMAGDPAEPQALKPMNCPGHVQIFKHGQRSLRDLPLRLAEFGICHRNEPSGAVLGLMRGRAFTQDDAHIFCTDAQIVPEVATFCGLLQQVYADFGFDQVEIGFSTRSEQRHGSDAVWDRAEAALAAAAQAAGLDYVHQPGEGAFYGPKLEFVLKDRRGRRWQCGTIQLDYVLPERLDVSYVGPEDEKVRPVMIHHAVLGSLERFIGILLEHHRGRLPLWLAPDQVMVATVGPEQADYANAVAEALRDKDYRVRVDSRQESLSKKVAEAHDDGVPVFLAVGSREAANHQVAYRNGEGRSQPLSLEALDAKLRAEDFR